MIALRKFAAVAGVVLASAFAVTRLLAFVPSQETAAPATLSKFVETAQVERLQVVKPKYALTPLLVAARVSKPETPGTIAEEPFPPERAVPDPALAGLQAEAVARHLAAKIPAHLVPYFETFIYVSKAKSGSWAQNLFLFRKSGDGAFVFEQSFLISTGRERSEKYFTTTPTGIFTLDPDRLMRMAYSGKWHNAPMPHAMFLDYSYRTQMSGVALHAAVGRALGDLGFRASGGCVRLPPEKATMLFDRIKSGPRTMVPVFAFDAGRGTTNVDGQVMNDSAGRVILKQGIPTLLLIDAEPGPAVVLSTL